MSGCIQEVQFVILAQAILLKSSTRTSSDFGGRRAVFVWWFLLYLREPSYGTSRMECDRCRSRMAGRNCTPVARSAHDAELTVFALSTMKVMFVVPE